MLESNNSLPGDRFYGITDGMKRLIFSLLLAVTVSGVRADDKPTVFVAPMDGDSAIAGWQPALGKGLSEMLITELGRLGKFDVLESTALNDLKGEIALGDQGYVSDKEKVDKGGWAGADFMFVGKVTRFGSVTKGVNLGGFVPFSGGNLGTKTTTSDIAIDWRFVDAYTRKVIKTGRTTASHKGTSFAVGVAVNGNGGNIGFNNSEFMDSALGKATATAVTNLSTELAGIDVPESGRHKAKSAGALKEQSAAAAAIAAVKSIPGTVLAVINKETLIVSLGSKQGLKTGDKLNLYETVDTKNDKGEVVFSEEKLVGEVTLASVQAEKSKATFAGTAEVKSGWVVKGQ